MKNKFGIIVSVLMIIALVSVMILRQNTSYDKGNLLMAVYSRYDFSVLQTNVTSNSLINEKKMTFDEMEGVIQKVLEIFDIRGQLEINKRENDAIKEYSVTRAAQGTQTVVRLENVCEIEDVSYKTYLNINIVLYEQIDGANYVQEKLNEIYALYNSKPNINITMAGSYDKKLSSKECKELTKNIMSSIRGEIVNEYETDKLYSAYGYTSLIKDKLNVMDKKVNINVAIRYNEYEKKTYLYLASPIISVDY